MFQSKDIGYMNGEENMTHTFITCKRPSSEKKTYTDSKWRTRKKYSKQIGGEKATLTYIRQKGLQTKAIKRDTEGGIHQEVLNIVNIYTPNTGAPKYIRKILKDFKKDIDRNRFIIGDFNIPLSTIDQSSKQNINNDIVALNNVLDWIDNWYM